jgi:hypothetical protein
MFAVEIGQCLFHYFQTLEAESGRVTGGAVCRKMATFAYLRNPAKIRGRDEIRRASLAVILTDEPG